MKNKPGRPNKTRKKLVKPEIKKQPVIEIQPNDDLGNVPISPVITPIEPQFKRLLSLSGFIEAFWEFLSYYQKHEDAYEAVERQYEAQFGERKYASFESFRNCRDNYLRSNKPDQKNIL